MVEYKSAIPQNAIIHSFPALRWTHNSCIIDNIWLNINLILAGAILGAATEAIVGLLSSATLRLARPNAVMIRLLTPILILPWALVVDTLTA